MTYWHIDPTAATNGTGTEASPFNTWPASFTPGSGDVVLGKSGTVINAKTPQSMFTYNNIRFGTYGKSGGRFYVDGGTHYVCNVSFTQHPTYTNIWYKSYSGYSKPSFTAGLDLGNIREGGRLPGQCNILKYIGFDFTNGISSTSASMTPGSYSFDAANDILYVYPTASAAVDLYVSEIPEVVQNYSPSSGLIMENWGFIGASNNGANFNNALQNASFFNCEAWCNGGAFRASWNGTASGWTKRGNGIQFSADLSGSGGGSNANMVIDSCLIHQIWDSGISPQGYASNEAFHDILIKNCDVSTCGLAGIELSFISSGVGATPVNASMSWKDALVIHNTIHDCGKGFSGRSYNISGNGVIIDCPNYGTTSIIENMVVQNNDISNNMGCGIAYSNTQGVNHLIIGNRITNNHSDGITFHSQPNIVIQGSTYTYAGQRVIMQGNVIANNGYNGFNCDVQNFANPGMCLPGGGHTGSTVVLSNNTFYNNGTNGAAGVQNSIAHANINLNNAGATVLQNNIIYGGAIGIQYVCPQTITVKSNNIFNVTTPVSNAGTASGFTSPIGSNGNISVDPLFVPASQNNDGWSWLQMQSPMRRAGASYYLDAVRGMYRGSGDQNGAYSSNLTFVNASASLTIPAVDIGACPVGYAKQQPTQNTVQ